jgi:5-deoxy-D-glucuronate isomerase
MKINITVSQRELEEMDLSEDSLEEVVYSNLEPFDGIVLFDVYVSTVG